MGCGRGFLGRRGWMRGTVRVVGDGVKGGGDVIGTEYNG